MTTPTLHRTERRTQFPRKEFFSPKLLKEFFGGNFYTFKDAQGRADELFQEWLNSTIPLTVWCTECYAQYEYCSCEKKKATLDQWRIPTKDLVAMYDLVEKEEVVLSARGNIHTREFVGYVEVHSS